MSSNCVLVTMEYPFCKGESFLENEIKYLSESFDRVYIFALSAHGKQTRETPHNVIPVPLKNNASKTRYIHYTLRGILPFGRIGMKEMLPAATLKSFLASLYARGRVHTSYKKIISILDLDFNKESPTFVAFYSYWFMDQALLACLLGERYRTQFLIKIISRAHGYDLYESRNKINSIPFRELVFKKIDAVYPCSKDGADYLIQKYPKWKEKVKVAYLGTIDYGMQIIQNKQDQVFHIVTCSNLIPLKRIHLVAEALATLKSRQIENIHWTCIGDGPEMPRIVSIIHDNNISNQISIKGRLANKEVIDFYKSHYCDLFINVSTSEGLPVSIMEAQSFGIPVIATDVGGTREIVDNSCGTLLSQDISSGELATIIENYYSLNEESLQEYRRNARHNWEKLFNADINYKKFILEICGK
ncbi:Glycosyltransferase involved in cell wall bisynthesis [Sphaerochaeta associata]|nr:Glycosyltransferase involved in cell wall bisynthesis [Sphaerochaeta associata]